MSREFLVVCGTGTKEPAAWRKNAGTTIQLDATPVTGNVRAHIADIAVRMVADLPDVAEDLIRLAAYVYAADQAAPRGNPDQFDYGSMWRRRLRFVVPVRRPEVWSSDGVRNELVRTLSFLSDDDYEFAFVPYKHGAGWDEFLFGNSPRVVSSIDEVMLFSGGMDSLAGAVQEILVHRRKVALVSHRPVTKLDSRQTELAGALSERANKGLEPFHIPVVVNKKVHLGKDFTQRTRSFLFVSLATVIARLFGLTKIRIYENGVVSCNLPICAQVLGGRASRTTHPRVLAGFGRLFKTLFELPSFDLENPFAWQTRTDVVEQLRAAGHAELVGHTVSCAHTHAASTDQPHCGTCSQCIDRRLAVLAARLTDADDPAERYRVDLLTGDLRNVVEQTMVERVVGTAREIETILTPTRFLQRFGEAARLLRHIPGSADTSATRLFELHRRHARQVNGALNSEVVATMNSGRWSQLRPTCLLRMMVSPFQAAIAGQMPSDVEPKFVPTGDDILILKVLQEGDRTLHHEDIAAACKRARATIGVRIRVMLRYDLVHYPRGKRLGVAITRKGRDLLKVPTVQSRVPA